MKKQTNRDADLKAALSGIVERTREIRAWLVTHPTDLAGIRDQLSPDGNGTCILYGRFARTLLLFARGEIPSVWLTEWQSEAMRLIEDLRRLYPEVESLHHTWNAQKGFYDLLCERHAEYETDEEYFAEIRRKLAVLKEKYRENSNRFNALVAEEARSARTRGKTAAPKRSRAANPEAVARREVERAVLNEIYRLYSSPSARRRKLSYRKIVRAMMAPGNTYSARMRGKSEQTWANQASAYCARRRQPVG